MPVRIITETRRSVRASVTKQALIIRVPVSISPQDRERGIQDMHKWAMKTYEEKPEAFAHFKKIALASAYTFDVQGDIYSITVKQRKGRDHRIDYLGDNNLIVVLDPKDPRFATGKLLPKLLGKWFGGAYHPRVALRILELNELHFQQTINRVKLSDTYSRWGSCSSKGNINIATRLILAPPEVLDAVIIHELAHLVEANHSDKFWAEVERALPNYKEYDEWLAEHGHELRFNPTPVTV